MHVSLARHTTLGLGVSPNHALALVNMGGTSSDLLDFSLEIQEAVEARFGISLEREPVVLERSDAAGGTGGHGVTESNPDVYT